MITTTDSVTAISHFLPLSFIACKTKWNQNQHGVKVNFYTHISKETWPIWTPHFKDFTAHLLLVITNNFNPKLLSLDKNVGIGQVTKYTHIAYRGCRGRDRMVVGFTTTNAIGAITNVVVSSNLDQGEVYNSLWSSLSVTCDRSMGFFPGSEIL